LGQTYHPSTNRTHFVEPNGAGITNTICRAELAAIAAAITHNYMHIATDSLTSLHQIRKQLLYPEKHRYHVQGDILQNISTLISNTHSTIFLYKVKSHAGIAGNECADVIAKHQATLDDTSLADTGIPSAGPGGNPFTNTFWLANRDIHQHPTNTSSSHTATPKLTYLPNLQGDLKSHMHAKHRLGYALQN
jgi:ribonuclease HI